MDERPHRAVIHLQAALGHQLAQGEALLAEVTSDLKRRGVNLRSLTDGVDTSSPTRRLLYDIVRSLAEFERGTIRERMKAGMAAARARGRQVGCRRAMRPEHVADARAKLTAGMSGKEVARFFGVSRATLYRALARESGGEE